MTHTIDVNYSFVWHDLTEDPTDLPKDDYKEYYTLRRSKETGELEKYFFYDYEMCGAKYNPEQKIWICYGEDRYGDQKAYGYSSYGLEHDPSSETDVEEFTKWEVVAWAEEIGWNKIPNYIPQMFKED